MTGFELFPQDSDAFAALEDDRAFVAPGARTLPYSPFAGRLTNFRLGQFSAVLSGDFASDLFDLVQAFGDDQVSCVVRDPSPTSYRLHYGGFPAFRIAAADLEERFWDALSHEPDDDPTGSIFESANIVAMWGSSHRWAGWAERSWDVGVVATERPWEPPASSDVAWVSAQEALDWFTEPDFKIPLAPADRARFLATFEAC
ncbi:MAG: hypothetical protein NTV28_00060 [Propionibacteriales bacterium]|nr:hypothetical protein [Propionibacteriales bacterium]